ncbi:sugar phosphate isomerase/epimerase and 4-hydroxyphenylpyruvate domain-containing protein [Acetobacter senegalensis]|uniref:bifunctional sugar phosphate isomerase/epimerase/4-hydroxyphenylpyruvate dioxygenase family protein n=1 Tax=Acetobacter senegalensis TaxID=446692 RepID=UPI00209D680E|nr:sugar phosphate isomerase/epimerase and 4-hydroxyphenylpyruvate domain-containing protein [Acetobacter senegalensis]MCP1196037.1 sugar phosphate isomerase/epimerase and 4-hydroxyphenylpyruvate domain-containing protein [Acetobacter senegalensis]
MLNGIATVSLGGTLREKLEAIAEAGFTAAEIFENDFVSSELSPTDVRMLMNDLGLRNILYQPFRNFEGLTGDARRSVFNRAERKFDLMQEMGTDLLLVCSSTLKDADGDHNRIVDDFRELGERAAQRGLRIGYEALAWGRHVNDHRQVAAIVNDVGLSSVGIILDSFHSLSRMIPPSSLNDIDPEKIFLVQMADAPLMDMDLLQWSRHFRCMPLQGGLPVTEWVASLMRIGYTGPLSLEIFNDRFRAGFSKMIAVDGYRSLIAVRDDARRLLTGDGILPPRPEAALQFIEFSTSYSGRNDLSRMLEAMGFRKTGVHRNRDVDLWQSSSGLPIILNHETESFSGSYSLVHGNSLCAIGVQVSDRKAAASRATGLGMKLVEGISDSLSQCSVPAIRSIGGSLVYLLDGSLMEELLEKEFQIFDSSKNPVQGGIVSFDHLASIVRYDEFLSWVLYWTSLFDLRQCQEVDLIDPGGVVQSQALENSRASLRVTLNGSLGGRTLASRFEKKFIGSGYQHLALETDDIFSFADSLKETNFPILHVGKNYYDDLQARFDLSDAMISSLSQRNIFYDRDETGGEFYQIFSRAIDKMFFFEIVQRSGNYAGYGAANTQVRLTAQRLAGETDDHRDILA